MSTRGVISSFAQSSESRRTPSIISASSGAKSPRSALASRTDSSSASESARRSRSRLRRKAREADFKKKLRGASTLRQKRSSRALAGASDSARRSAICFGVISPKTRSPTVITGTASTPPAGIHSAKSL